MVGAPGRPGLLCPGVVLSLLVQPLEEALTPGPLELQALWEVQESEEILVSNVCHSL